MGRDKRKKYFSWQVLFLFLFYQILFIGLSAPFLVFYGPFTNLKKTIVGTAMSTMRHQYIATTFLSSADIEAILGTAEVVASTSLKEDLNNIRVSYRDNDEIIRYDIHTNKFDGYLLEIKDPTRVKVAYTSKLGKAGQRTSEMAKDRQGVAAINGGSFADKSEDGELYAGTGAYPGGIVISEGKLIYSDVAQDRELNVLAFNQDGVLIVGDHSIEALREMGVSEALSFRPPTLIVNGKGQISRNSSDGLNPRTAIGQKRNGTVLFLVIDGRKGFKLGASLYDVQQILLQHGAWNAGNLDGGSSSTMYYDGEVINNPSNWDGERTVATSFYVRP